MAGSPRKETVIGLLLVGLVCSVACAARGQSMDEMSVDRWAKLREAERYQLQVAERYYRAEEWKAALAEYEKFLSLYEKSDEASFAQLKWSLCQIKLRKHNAAIKDGFQTLLDYWPESPDAPLAKYYIGQTNKAMGQIPQAKKAYYLTINDHPQHLATVRALTDLVEISEIENDLNSRVDLWKKLTFEVKRAPGSRRLCIDASTKLASYYFSQLLFNDGVKALATSFEPQEVPARVAEFLSAPLAQLAAAAETKTKAERLADQAVAYYKSKLGATTEPEAKKAAQQIWFHIADAYAGARRDNNVPETYAQIMKLFGTDDETLGRLAAWYDSRERYEEAAKTYRAFKDKPEGLGRLGASCRRRSDWDKAVAAYREAAAVDKNGPVRWLAEVGATYREARRVKEAVDTYQQLRNSDVPNAIKWLAEVAATYHYVRQLKQAIDTYVELLKVDPGNSQRWMWAIATTHQEAGQYKEAIGYYRQCTNFPENYNRMARCHRYLKQYPEALMIYNQIVGSDAGAAPGAMYQIGQTWEEAGKTEQAIKAYQALCKRFPKDSHASQSHALLQDKYKISVTMGGAKDE